MLDHISLGVTDLERSCSFYDAALRPVGIVRTVDFGNGSDYGTMLVMPSRGMHVCFRAPDRHAVRAFYAAALGEGGKDDGELGLYAKYHPDYFAAFVLDPDGHRVEVVCHAPEIPSNELD